MLPPRRSTLVRRPCCDTAAAALSAQTHGASQHAQLQGICYVGDDCAGFNKTKADGRKEWLSARPPVASAADGNRTGAVKLSDVRSIFH